MMETAPSIMDKGKELAERAEKARQEKAKRGREAVEASKRRRSRKQSKDVNFHNLTGTRRGSGLMDVLKEKYNAQLADEGNEFYTDRALLRRESLQFDANVMKALQFLWTTTDKNGSGAIDEDEYMSMHRAMHTALKKLGHLHEGGRTNEGQANWSIKLARKDWDGDREGSGILNFARFKVSLGFSVQTSAYTGFLTPAIHRVAAFTL